MPGLFGVLDTAGRSLSVTSRGIQTVSHNISNVETPGYSRQRQILGTASPTVHPAGHLGNGVEQVSVRRSSDTFVHEQLVRQSSLFGAADTQAQALSVVQEVFNELGPGGLTDGLNSLYDAFSDLASSPTPGASIEREGARAAALALSDTIHSLDARLRAEQGAADEAIESTLVEINRLTQEIHVLNDEIVELEIRAPANDARDARDQRVRELAELVDLQTFEHDNGRLHVALSSGLALVEGETPRRLEAIGDTSHPFDPSFSQVRYTTGSSSVDITAMIGSGRLGGILRARDTLLAGAIRTLDTIAYNLTTSVNALHTTGTGTNGAVGDFFAAPAAVEDAARGLALDAGILGSVDSIAAGITSAASDNRVAQQIAALRTTPTSLFLPGDPPGPATGPSRTLLEQVAVVVTDAGEQARMFETSRNQQERVVESLENRREAVSGVSLDEEMTQLIELQAAFQANSRLMSLVDELLGDLLDII
jgi:flagellar hook-associated protein 1 FlgK